MFGFFTYRSSLISFYYVPTNRIIVLNVGFKKIQNKLNFGSGDIYYIPLVIFKNY